jgi:hypothetical protein
MILSQRKSDGLVPVHYDSAHSSSTSTTPDPEEMARVYDLQLRRQRERTTIDWEAEAAIWGEETRTWVEEVQQAGDEALLGDLPTNE